MEELTLIPSTINGLPVIAYRPATLAPGEICSVVVCRRSDDYIVWSWNRQTTGAFNGHYGMTAIEAAEQFAKQHRRVPTARWTINATASEHERYCFEIAGLP